MALYKIIEGSVKNMGDKTGLTVTFTDEVNGKVDCTCYHEIESVDSTVIAEQLSKAALEYEARAATSPVAPVLVVGQEVVAEAPVESPVAPVVQ